jgi:chloramphenicol 3-O-phosphotransferase
MDYEIKPKEFYRTSVKIDKVLAGDVTVASDADLLMDEKLPETVFLLIGISGKRMDIIKAFETETLARLYQNCGMVGGYLEKYCGGMVIKRIQVHKSKSYDYNVDASIDNFKSVEIPVDVEGEIVVERRAIENKKDEDTEG